MAVAETSSRNIQLRIVSYIIFSLS